MPHTTSSGQSSCGPTNETCPIRSGCYWGVPTSDRIINNSSGAAPEPGWYCDCHSFWGLEGYPDCNTYTAQTYVQLTFSCLCTAIFLALVCLGVAAMLELRRRDELRFKNLGNTVVRDSLVGSLFMVVYCASTPALTLLGESLLPGAVVFLQVCAAAGASLSVLSALNLGVLWLDIVGTLSRGYHPSTLSRRKVAVYCIAAILWIATLVFLSLGLWSEVGAFTALVGTLSCIIIAWGSRVLYRMLAPAPLAIEVRRAAFQMIGCAVLLVAGGVIYFIANVSCEHSPPGSVNGQLNVVGPALGFFAIAWLFLTTTSFVVPAGSAVRGCCASCSKRDYAWHNEFANLQQQGGGGSSTGSGSGGSSLRRGLVVDM